MIKKLSAIGGSLGVIIERPILEVLDITKDTELEIRTDGEALIIRPGMEIAYPTYLGVARASHPQGSHDHSQARVDRLL